MTLIINGRVRRQLTCHSGNDCQTGVCEAMIFDIGTYSADALIYIGVPHGS